jgi:anti-sigma regulatory factor (Ser/Thr protein kinase)
MSQIGPLTDMGWLQALPLAWLSGFVPEGGFGITSTMAGVPYAVLPRRDAGTSRHNRTVQPFHLVAPDRRPQPSGKSPRASRSRQVQRDISRGRAVTTQPRARATGGDTPAHGHSTPGPRHEWRLRSIGSSLSFMRRELRASLDGSGLSSDEIEDLILVASEAAANAVDHAHSKEPFFDVCTEVADGAVTIIIQDRGQWRQSTSNLERGRGLAMMHALADTNVVAGVHGTTVTIRNRRSDYERLSDSSEWLSWRSCPSGSQRAAMGWTVDRVVDLVCYAECELTEAQMAQVRHQCADASVPLRPYKAPDRP